MDISVDKETFFKYIQLLDKVTGKQLNLEVLRCILLEAKKNRLFLRATNLDIGIEVELPCKSKKDGLTAIPAEMLSGFLANTPTGTVELNASEKGAHISIGKTKATINTISHEDFPTIPRVKSGDTIKLTAEKLAKGLRSVWYAASISNMKPELSSILVTHREKSVVFVATDSFRLAEKTILTDTTNSFSPILIPLKNVGEIIRNIEQVEGEITITTNDNQASIVAGDTHITSRLVDGTFPDYQQIIPKEFAVEVVALKQDVLQALKVTNIFTNRFGQVTVHADPKKKQFTIEAHGGEMGESTAAVEATLSGDAVDASFNQKYILDSFQSIADDSVMLRLSSDNKPMVIRGASDRSFLYLTMPMSR